MKKTRVSRTLFLVPMALLLAFLVGCNQLPTASVTPLSDEVTVRYTLQAVATETGYAYLGVGGDIDGIVNPELSAFVGDVIEIILINESDVLHDIVIPDLDAVSDKVVSKGDQVSLVFKVSASGSFSYYCSVPGHRSAGMEGRFVVSSTAAFWFA